MWKPPKPEFSTEWVFRLSGLPAQICHADHHFCRKSVLGVNKTTSWSRNMASGACPGSIRDSPVSNGPCNVLLQSSHPKGVTVEALAFPQLYSSCVTLLFGQQNNYVLFWTFSTTKWVFLKIKTLILRNSGIVFFIKNCSVFSVVDFMSFVLVVKKLDLDLGLLQLLHSPFEHFHHIYYFLETSYTKSD